ncbi:prolyl oligopeptidase family serine peptidase [Streptomyces sp. JJ36]|uniref:prolyl oligopeptidase family serine peptidase n=1 Tax=Streptomyces sp. JJ36 TaxID=2736645 RepID=UPI001F0264AA|nr:prolyl oligopeptidase family serine peptidase [Streptomyces sp. JJ36]MCF6525453.1 S9 family peptidase [Streptomyces sp. JJ36]
MKHTSAPREALVENLHGHGVADPYRWLEDDEDARTRAFVREQDAMFRAVRETWPGRGEWWRALTAYTRPRSAAPPLIRGTRRFTLTHTHAAPHPRLSVADTATGTHHTVNLGAPASGEHTVVRGVRPSWEGDRLVCMVSTGGSDQVTLHILDATTGEPLEPALGPLPAAWPAWLPGGAGFYYVGYPGPPRAQADATDLRVRLHHVGGGAGAADDPVVFGDLDPGGYYGLTIEPAGHWLAVTVSRGATSRNALWLASLHTDPAAPRWRRVTDHTVGAVAPKFGTDGRLYLLTDHGAPRGRVCAVHPADLRPETWREVVPEDPEAVLDDCVLLDTPSGPGALVLRTRHGVSELALHDPFRARRPAPVRLPGAGLASSLRADPRGGSEAWLLYSDFGTPAGLHRYDTRTGRLTRCRDVPRPRGSAPAVPPVHSRLVEYPAADGTTVRMFLLTPGREPAGPRPTVLSGYGGFGVPLRPVYSPVVLAWVAAGGHYALACVRGGGEEGRAWHEAGRGRRKKTAVEDFTAAADWLVRRGLTEPGMLAAAGASHGGFLVAAAATRRPDLFAAVLCADPLLDMVRYQRLGIGATWTDEFGSADDPVDLACLLEISPYHQVREGTDYPAILFSGGTDDPRLGAAHVRKMCAALQHAGAPPSRAVMRREPGVGHGARSPQATLALNADALAFLGTHTGLRPRPGGGAPPDGRSTRHGGG